MAQQKRSRLVHFPDFSVKRAGLDITLDLSRIEGNFEDAQFALDSAIMTSMEPFMPMQDGTFINRTKAESAALAGTGKVVAAVPPSGRFLYAGNMMIGSRSRSAWAKKGEKKVVTGQKLQYTKTKNPQARAKWFDAAKKKDGDEWVSLVKEIAGGK